MISAGKFSRKIQISKRALSSSLSTTSHHQAPIPTPWAQSKLTFYCNSIEIIGQFSGASVWMAVGGLQTDCEKFSGGYPLLLIFQGVASAIPETTFGYIAYRIVGDSHHEAKQQLPVDFLKAILINGIWSFMSDSAVSVYRHEPFREWAVPAYTYEELGVAIGMFQCVSLVNFVISESVARRQGPYVCAETLDRLLSSFVLGLGCTWFFYIGRWDDVFYSDNGDTVSKRVSDAFVGGASVAVFAFVVDMMANAATLIKNIWLARKASKASTSDLPLSSVAVSYSDGSAKSLPPRKTRYVKVNGSGDEEDEVEDILTANEESDVEYSSDEDTTEGRPSNYCTRLVGYMSTRCSSMLSRVGFFSAHSQVKNVVSTSGVLALENKKQFSYQQKN